jgi:hypothetical protein
MNSIFSSIRYIENMCEFSTLVSTFGTCGDA